MRLENSSKMASPRNDIDATPICRCRVLYLGSSVPHITKDGLQGIQEPLRELYPEQGALGAKGIDSWLSVWSNGILLENVDENHQKVTRFFPIDSLHYCAAVRYVLVPEKGSAPSARFLPLDSPFARSPNPSHPPLFAAILRRTTGIKVLECHAFICKREMASNALVRCCFHAYADHSYARHLAGNDGARNNDGASVYGTMRPQGFSSSSITLNTSTEDLSVYNGDENHKVWSGPNNGLMMNPEEDLYANYSIRSLRSQRPRQQQTTQTPPPPPPPPPQQQNTNTLKESKKKEKKLKKKKHASREDIFSTNSLMRQPGMYRAQSMQTMYHPPIAAYGPTPVPPPHAMRFTPVPPPATPIVMVHHPQAAATLPHPRKIFHHHGQPQQLRRRNFEEPLYLPSGRAQSPVASFQPGHFPHEAYLMQHFATMDPKRHHQPPPQHHQSQQNLNVTNDDEENFNTGIYRRKGHINERAFSYSIRQEHRSRSYGSLANLKFAPTPTTPHPQQNGAASSGEERKKEREIIQMMHDLDVAEGKGFRSPSAGPSGMVHHYGTNGRR